MSFCPKCEQRGRVIDSRPDHIMHSIRRRHVCPGCGERWTTLEIEESRYRLHQKSTKILTALKQAIDNLTSGE